MKRMNNINIVNQLTGVYGVLITHSAPGLGASSREVAKDQEEFL